MQSAPRLPVFRVSGRIARGERATVVEVVAKSGAVYRLRREFADSAAGRIDATRLADAVAVEGSINPAKWVRVGCVDDMEHEGLLESEYAATGDVR